MQLKNLDYQKITKYCRQGYFPYKSSKDKQGYVIAEQSIINSFKENDLEFTLVTRAEFFSILQSHFKHELKDNAINQLDKIGQNLSAKSINYRQLFSIFITIFFTFMILAKNIFAVVNSVVYLMQNVLKAILFHKGLANVAEHQTLKVNNDTLPIYSILVPLYKEEKKVPSIIRALGNLNYPKDKLDIKLILEEDDEITLNAIGNITLDKHIGLIRVPYFLPRTKPKALNYAMPFVIGKYLTVYDAEDEPDPDQLLKALDAFNNLPEDYVCLQSKLNFYNAKENILTTLFSIEYSIWFEYLLKGLDLFGLPITLGGTSNHFKVDKLIEVGSWDAYNVTEDADLGIRLYLRGYKVSMINSTTLEEVPNNLKDWTMQRSRWIKGFIQTILVFSRNKNNFAKLGLLKYATVVTFIGLSTYSILFLPWLFFVLYLDLNQFSYYIWLINSFFSFSYLYAIAYFVLAKNDSQINIKTAYGILVLLIWPFYFILHTIAGYKSIFDIITSPFKWSKTPHGNNKLKR